MDIKEKRRILESKRRDTINKYIKLLEDYTKKYINEKDNLTSPNNILNNVVIMMKYLHDHLNLKKIDISNNKIENIIKELKEKDNIMQYFN